ncbi:hypothetical protein D3C87_862690 [compost metagenome]
MAGTIITQEDWSNVLTKNGFTSEFKSMDENLVDSIKLYNPLYSFTRDAVASKYFKIVYKSEFSDLIRYMRDNNLVYKIRYAKYQTDIKGELSIEITRQGLINESYCSREHIDYTLYNTVDKERYYDATNFEFDSPKILDDTLAKHVKLKNILIRIFKARIHESSLTAKESLHESEKRHGVSHNNASMKDTSMKDTSYLSNSNSNSNSSKDPILKYKHGHLILEFNLKYSEMYNKDLSLYPDEYHEDIIKQNNEIERWRNKDLYRFDLYATIFDLTCNPRVYGTCIRSLRYMLNERIDLIGISIDGMNLIEIFNELNEAQCTGDIDPFRSYLQAKENYNGKNERYDLNFILKNEKYKKEMLIRIKKSDEYKVWTMLPKVFKMTWLNARACPWNNKIHIEGITQLSDYINSTDSIIVNDEDSSITVKNANNTMKYFNILSKLFDNNNYIGLWNSI